MFMKLVDDRNGIISMVSEKTLNLLKEQQELATLNQMKLLSEKMEGIKKQLAGTVQWHEIPQPVLFKGRYLNYANSLLINGVALVPRFHPESSYGETAPDARLYPEYEDQVRKVYQNLGYTVKFIDADALIEDGGALHCATIVLPRLQSQGAAQSVIKMGN
jgi:agmatine/peptidylarginine deiminase